jgi:hypothetical protein
MFKSRKGTSREHAVKAVIRELGRGFRVEQRAGLAAVLVALACAFSVAVFSAPVQAQPFTTPNAVVKSAFHAPTASAATASTLGPVVPGGISATNDTKGAPASANSGISPSGSVTTSQDTANCNKHSRMLVLIHVVTQVKVYVCTKCANPRMFTTRPPAFHSFSRSTVLAYYKTVTKKLTMVCRSSGQKITAPITVTIKGKLKGRVWGKLMGLLKARLKVAFNAAVKIKAGNRSSSNVRSAG